MRGFQETAWDPGGLQQRLEGKPHFKRWGMSWTGPPLGQWAGVMDWAAIESLGRSHGRAAIGPLGQPREEVYAGNKREKEQATELSNRTRHRARLLPPSLSRRTLTVLAISPLLPLLFPVPASNSLSLYP